MKIIKIRAVAWLSIASLVCASAQANLLNNGGFEAQDGVNAVNAADWNQGGSQGRENWAAEWGNWGFAFYGWISNGTGFVEQNVTCDTNATYYFRIRGRREKNFSTGNVDMRLRFFESSTNWIAYGEYTNAGVTTSSSTNWTTYEIVADAPPTAGVVQVRCDFSAAMNPPANHRAFEWDNATLYDRRRTYRPAEIIDEFSYDPDFYDSISGKDRGNGFAAAWSNLWGIVDITDYSFPAVTGYPKPYGNKLHIPNTGGGALRSFAAVTNGSLYAAAYFNYGNAHQGDWAGISFMSNGTERAFFGGNSGGQPVMKLALDSFGGTNRVDSSYELSAGIGEDYIIIGRYDFETHLFSAKAFYKSDTVPFEEPDNWDVSVTLDAGRMPYVNGIRLACGGVNPGDVYFDELRVAQNWYDLLNNDEPPPVGMVFTVQ